jgi:hypothetical protein
MAADAPAAAPSTARPTTEVPWELNVPIADVYIVGYGLRLPNDFTLEMLAILKRCKRVFGAPPIDAPAFGIPPMEDLGVLCAPDKRRKRTYEEMVARVLDAAAEDGPVAFATYGSAMVGTLPAHRLLERAPGRGLRVHVANAPSSFDGIWTDFNIEPFFGLQIWEATAFVAREVVPDTKANLLLPQAPVYRVMTGPDTASLQIEPSREVSGLQAYLGRFYPADHIVHIAMTSMTLGDPLRSTVTSVRLGELDTVQAPVYGTLLVPRLERSNLLDFEGPASSVGERAPAGDGPMGGAPE